jgi:CDP-glucose 4,6-dehydratase
MGLDLAFWKERRVFLTGHTGFKGAWLSLWLSHLGAHVTGYSLDPPTEPNLFGVARVHDRLAAHHHADVLDLPTLQLAMEHSNAEVVIHMAAQSLVRESYREPVHTYAVNILGTVNLLEAARRTSCVKAVVIVTTDKCYGDTKSSQAYREIDPVGGDDPYSSSKACAELVTAAYRASFAASASPLLCIASARAGNVIGGGDWATDRLIPDCIRAFSANQPVVLRYPKAVRPWQHVLEPLSGYLELAERLVGDSGKRYATAWNFGPDPCCEANVADVAAMTAELWGSDANVQLATDRSHPLESALLRLDSTKAKCELGWRQVWPLARSLGETVGWYRALREGRDMQEFSISQIDAYLSAAA